MISDLPKVTHQVQPFFPPFLLSLFPLSLPPSLLFPCFLSFFQEMFVNWAPSRRHSILGTGDPAVKEVAMPATLTTPARDSYCLSSTLELTHSSVPLLGIH